MQLDRNKLKALVLYVIWRTGHQDGFGATKLNKVLWFADSRRFEVYGKPITGETYIRQPHGPVPKHLDEIKCELEADGSVRPWREMYFDKVINRYLADAPPDTSMFETDELILVDWWIKHIGEEHTASTISELSHNYTWQIAAMGEEIPLHAVFADRVRDPTDEEMEWARAEAKRLSLS